MPLFDDITRDIEEVTCNSSIYGTFLITYWIAGIENILT